MDEFELFILLIILCLMTTGILLYQTKTLDNLDWHSYSEKDNLKCKNLCGDNYKLFRGKCICNNGKEYNL